MEKLKYYFFAELFVGIICLKTFNITGYCVFPLLVIVVYFFCSDEESLLRKFLYSLLLILFPVVLAVIASFCLAIYIYA